MAWENPVTTWGQAGKTVPGAGDFNRIEGNTQYLKDEVDSHKAKDASTTAKGHVQLSSSTSSTSTSLAATASAVKTVNDALTSHQAEKATQSEYGHIRLQDIPNPEVATKAEAEAGTNNTKMMTPLRTNQAIDSRFRWVDGLLEVNINGEWKSFKEIDDTTGSPGSPYLLSGTMEEGFFGEVSASELITGDALASECGISQGTSQHSTAGWLKFAYKGKIQFIAKNPIRSSISWDAINTAKCVYGDSGDKQIIVDGKTYKVRLMRALDPSINPKATASAYSGTVNHGSEWNRLMCQIHEEAINGSWGYPNNIESDIGILKHSLGSGNQGMYNDADLVVKSGDGRASWCQEMSTSTSNRLLRGDDGVSFSHDCASSWAIAHGGWRPVLELVP